VTVTVTAAPPATTTDSTAPTRPTGLRATAVSGTRMPPPIMLG
jgi:hypothetical protein